MAEVSLNSLVGLLRGSVGNLTFKVINGKLHATQKVQPKWRRKKWTGTPKQVAWRSRFRRATQFALAVKRNPALLAFYQALAKKHGKRLRDICLSDYFTIPQIEAVDLSHYAARPGDRIRCRAYEKYPLSGVEVYLSGANGVHESGPATRRGKTWTYTATLAMPPGKVSIQITASDHANESGVHRAEWMPKG